MENQTKLRLLYLYQHLLQHTDADHPLSTPQLIEILDRQYGIEVNRNTLANDFKMLKEAGVRYEVIHFKQNKYYYDGRIFDTAELKVLIDAISSSEFISERKSRELIDKILTPTTEHEAGKLRRHVQVEGRVKSDNERGYYIVDVINDAIDRGCKIKFQYADYGPKKRKVLRHGGEPYIVSPYALVWDGDYYYVIGYSETRGKVQNFRLDRIFHAPDILKEEEAVPAPEGFNLAEYKTQVFRMFGTDEPVKVELLCKNYTMNGVIDHFGTKIRVKNVDEEHFRIEPTVCPSPTFYRWVFGWGGDMKILGPENVKEEYKSMARKALEE